MNQTPPDHGLDARALHIIRVAFLIGPLAFGAFVWFYLGDIAQPRLDPAAADLLGLVFLAAASAAAVALLLVRIMRDRARDINRRVGLTVAGWAVGEAIGLLGGVAYMLTATRLPLLVGIALLFVSMMLLPVPVASRPAEP